MIMLVRVLDRFTSGLHRIIKILGMGKSDVQTAYQVLPYGTDCNPVKGMVGLYIKTSIKGENVLVGYINKNQITAIGEHRIFSTDENGNVKTSIHLKNDGTMEIGGDADFMVRYSKLEEAFNQLKQDHNILVNKFNSHAHTVSGASAEPVLPLFVSQQSNADITAAKINNIKTA